MRPPNFPHLISHSHPLSKSIFTKPILSIRPFHTTYRRPQQEPNSQNSPDDPLYDKTTDKRYIQPQRLARPLGVVRPPNCGENSGIDRRSWSQRRDDFVDYDKHLEKRQKLTERVAKPYFRDFSRLSKDYKGKTFIAPPVLFRAENALYFPNLQGRTLLSPDVTDTTLVLTGRVSVVCVYSSKWGEDQIKTFVDSSLDEMECVRDGGAQRVDVTVEDNWAKALIVKMCIPAIRGKVPEERHGKYFIVRRGLDDDLRNEIGMVNQKVGYVYLVDANCRIRWAGSANAEPEEKEAMLRGVQKLVAEQRMKIEEKKEARGFIKARGGNYT